MLVMFRFKNYGPFKDEAVLDMRAVKAYKEHPDNLITKYPDMPLLKVAAIYGANASGKSQFVDAYQTFYMMVRNSFQSNNEDSRTSFLKSNYLPFMFDNDSYLSDTEFEIILRVDEYEYNYGFSYNRNSITSEWLYLTSLATNRKKLILERTGSEFDLGASVRRSCEKYIPDIDSDVLALSFFKTLKLRNPIFTVVYYAIMSFLTLHLSGEEDAELMLHIYFMDTFDGAEKPKLLKFLNAIDVGIQDIDVEKSDNNMEIITYHKLENGGLCAMPIGLESDGTRRAIALYSFLRVASNSGGLIIDEFHSQLHPLLQKYIIDVFYESSTGGQLIYTTHDTTLLDKRFTRRDQIWFTEKNEDGKSTLYSLSDFKVRDFDSFAKDYLSGNYGAIPNLKDFSFYGGTADGEG